MLKYNLQTNVYRNSTPYVSGLLLTRNKQEDYHCDKKLAHLFDFGIEPQVLSTQQTMIFNNRLRQSYFVDDGHTLLTTAVVLCPKSKRRPY